MPVKTLTTSAHGRPGTASVHPWSPAGPPRSSGSSSLTPPAPGSAPEPPSRLPPPCLPICSQNTRPSTSLSCLRMSTRAPGPSGSSASPTRNLRTQHRTFVSPPATSSWPPGPSKCSSSRCSGLPISAAFAPTSPGPFQRVQAGVASGCSVPANPLTVTLMGSPYLSSPVEVSQARCGPVTPNSAPKHILPKCDSDQTRSVSLTPCRPSRSAVPLRAALGSAYVAASPPPGPSVNRTLGHPQTLPLYPVATGLSLWSFQLECAPPPPPIN